MNLHPLSDAMRPKPGQTIVVWFSCGAASAVAAKLATTFYRDCIVRVVNNPVAEEDDDNRRFLADVQDWINIPIEIASSSKYPTNSARDVWEHRKFMAGPHGAPCTIELKKVARQEWEAINHHDWLILGFTADEVSRHKTFALTERLEILPILIAAQLTKNDCYRVIQDAGIALPRTYEQGWPNANCPGCVKASSPTYWNHVRQHRPDVFADRVEQSRRLGAKLVRVNNQRIYLDELSPDAKGRPMKSLPIVECGIFCEEPAH